MKKQICVLLAIFACVLSCLYGDFDETLVFIDGTDSLYIQGDTTYVRTQIGGMRISSQGIIRACVIFVDVFEESTHRNDWPSNEPPNFMNQFINAEPGAVFPYSNISKFYYSMSFGSNQVIGDAYYYSLPFHPGDIPNLSLGYLNTAVIQGMDNQIDYSQYDNWTRTSNYNFTQTPDGIVDMLIIIYKFAFSDYLPQITYTAIAGLFMVNSPLTTNDGVSFDWNSGITQGSGKHSFEYTKYVTYHEYAHYLLGPHTGRIAELGILSGNQVAYSDSKGMCAFEKERLGWIAYTDVPNPLLNDPYYYPLSDYMTTGYALRIPTSISTKYYVIENRQKISEFDKAWDVGIYIYLVNESGIRNNVHPLNPQDGFYEGYVVLLSADGRYNFQNNSTSFSTYADFFNNLRILKTEPNPNPLGYDERDYYGSRYIEGQSRRFYCFKLWYDGDWKTGNAHQLGDAWGDTNDAFSLSHNKVFSQWSNPGLDPSFVANFSIEVTQENHPFVTIAIRRSSPQNASLARPMGLDGSTTDGLWFNIDWYQPNTELQPGFSAYELYHRQNASSTWNLLTSTQAPNAGLYIPYIGNPNVYCMSKRNYFKVRAVKSNPGGESNYSDELRIIQNDYIINNYTLPPNKSLIIGDSLVVQVTGSLNLQNNTSLQLGRGSQIVINPGASLTLGDNCIVKGTNKTVGNDIGSKIVVNGSIAFGTNVSFDTDADSWDGLVIDTQTPINVTGVSFYKADLATYSSTAISGCSFTECKVSQNGKDVTIQNSTFDGAMIKSFSKLENSTL